MKIEGIESFRFESARARRKLNLLDDAADARHDRRVEDLASRLVHRHLSDGPLGIDGPLHDEIALHAGMAGQRFVVASTGFVTMRHDDRSDIRSSSPGIVSMDTWSAPVTGAL